MDITLHPVTDWDKNIETLARAKANCAYNILTGRCHEGECTTCASYTRYNNCYNQLSDCDKLKCDDLAGWMYGYRKYSFKKRAKDKLVKFITIGVALGAAIALFASLKPAEEIRPHTMYRDDDFIVNVLHNTRANVHDVDRDGKVDCMDYTITFKREWDKLYNPRDCEILRFCDMKTAHLFVQVRESQYKSWYWVEPQGADNNYMISDVWGSKITSDKVFRGETQKWLKYGKK